MSLRKRLRASASLAVFAALASALLAPYQLPSARASHTPAPSSVTVAGSLQSELGCPGDWQPGCGATHLGFDANDQVWQGSFNVPAGNWEYKAPVNDNWDENYGRFAQQNGPNIPLGLAAASNVKFYYDHKSHWITSDRNAVIAVAPGSFQSELGCSGDWDPSCLRSWLQDPDEDGTYTFQTTALPAGNYETKVAIGEGWGENYGAGGVQNGPNISFNVPANNAPVAFSYDASTHVLTVTADSGPPPAGDVQWDGLRHDTFDAYYRSPFGAVPAGSPVTLRFRTAHMDVDGVYARVYTYDPATGQTAGPADHPLSFFENRTEDGTLYDVWAVTLATPSAPSVLYYKFRVTDQSDEDFYSDSYANDHDNLNQGGAGEAADGEPFPAFQLTVYEPSFETPAWLHAANVYQIFPDRFRNGDPSNDYCRPGSASGCPTFYGGQTPLPREPWNTAIGDPRQPGEFQHQYGTQFYGGDLRGIEGRLDYLQALGVDTLYLNPIFKATSNHRYDADNFLEVDPALGGDAALASLAREAERRGVRLIFDGVFNHSSSDSVYFDRYHRYDADGGCESLASPFRGWYNFFNSDAPCDGADYEGWFGFDSLAVFNESAPVRDFFYRGGQNVTKHWYERGAAGWRFDVANEISHGWWNEYRGYAKGYKPDGPLVGEIWEDASQYLAGDQLDSVMNYRFRKNVLGFARGANWSDNDNHGGNQIVGLTPSQFDRALRSVREDYPPQATAAMLNLLGSHDTNRALYVLTLLGDSGLSEAKERLKLSALFQFAYPGAPMVYYGDEVALDSPALGGGVNGPEDDPYNRAPYPWADEAGDANVYGPADGGVLGFYSTLAHLRKQHESLRSGSFRTLLTGDTTPAAGDDNTYAFARVAGAEAAVVALNNGAGQNTAAVPVAAFYVDGAQLQDALTGSVYTVAGGAVQLTLGARAGVILLPFPAVVDLAAPVASVGTTPAANGDGWHDAAPVTVELGAADAGSGVRELRYWVNDGAVTVAPGAQASFQLSQPGVYAVGVRAIDHAGNISAAATRVVRIDTSAPAVGPVSVTPGVLTTPNHKMVDVAVGYAASDDSGAATCTLSVTSNEAADGAGDGDTAPDWEVVNPHLVRLRAERSGSGAGRVYTVAVNCADAAGNSTTRTATVSVPRGKK